jgi:hypothetical protein
LALVRGVLTDVDDTLVRDGALGEAAAQALHRLADAGVPVVAVTGRPALWCRPFVRDWPVAAIVAENGGVLLSRDVVAADGVRQQFSTDAATLARRQQRLSDCLAQVLKEVPGAVPARDAHQRLTDIAIDHAEHASLDAEGIAQVIAVMARQGVHATVSSIHVNGWIGTHDKATGAEWAVREALRLRFDPDQWLCVGDSVNDQRLFERVALSVGVANVARFLPQLDPPPAFITRGEAGEGFAELVDALLAARAARAAHPRSDLG